MCGQCHREGTPVSSQLHIDQHNIISNYTESIHGEGLLKKGLIVAANCASCHTAHTILPHTDPKSSIARRNIAADLHQVPRRNRSGAPQDHPRRAVGERSQRSARLRRLPPAAQDTQCLLRARAWPTPIACVATPTEALKSADGRSMFVKAAGTGRLAPCQGCLQPVPLGGERLASRPCATITKHGGLQQVPRRRSGSNISSSIHGQLLPSRTPMLRTCTRLPRHARHSRQDGPAIEDVPDQRSHPVREAATAKARRPPSATPARSTTSFKNYVESIHGKGLLKSGLTVTATCTSCHTAHGELPAGGPELDGQPEERARHLRQVPSRHRRAVRPERALRGW